MKIVGLLIYRTQRSQIYMWRLMLLSFQFHKHTLTFHVFQFEGCSLHLCLFVPLAICYPTTLYATKKEIVVLEFAWALPWSKKFHFSPPLVTLLLTLLRPLLRDAWTLKSTPQGLINRVAILHHCLSQLVYFLRVLIQAYSAFSWLKSFS